MKSELVQSIEALQQEVISLEKERDSYKQGSENFHRILAFLVKKSGGRISIPHDVFQNTLSNEEVIHYDITQLDDIGVILVNPEEEKKKFNR